MTPHAPTPPAADAPLSIEQIADAVRSLLARYHGMHDHIHPHVSACPMPDCIGGYAALASLERRAQAAQAPETSEPSTTAFAWLLEGTHVPPANYAAWRDNGGPRDGPFPPQWWTGSDWSPDATKAMRFARRQDVEQFRDRYLPIGIAVEHGFSSLPQPPSPEPPASEPIRCANCGNSIHAHPKTCQFRMPERPEIF